MYLIINPSDIYYLTGVHSHDPGEILIIMNDEKGITLPTGRQVNNGGIIFCDPRTSALFSGNDSSLSAKADEGAGGDNSNYWNIIDNRDGWREEFKKYKNIVTDPDFLTQTLREKIEGYGVTLSCAKSPISKCRTIKTQIEIEKLRKSQELNKLVFEKIQPFLHSGVTEGEIARKIQILQLEVGGDGPSFPPIVAFGEHSAIPHHSPTDKTLRDGDVVLIDMGLIYQGYCSDMTRTFLFSGTFGSKSTQNCGEEINSLSSSATNFLSSGRSKSISSQTLSLEKQKTDHEECQNIVSLLQTVTNFVISWAKPGMRVADIDARAREMLGEYEPYFTHSLGHGVGIDIHEAPFLSSRSDEILEVGMVITIEPGVYFVQNKKAESIEQKVQTHKKSTTLTSSLLLLHSPRFSFGARYEEMCVVTEEGLELL